MPTAAAPDKLTANDVLALGDRAVEEAEEPLAECRVELATRALAELTHGIVVGEGPTIRAMVGHGLVGLGDQEDWGEGGDGVTRQPSGIARAVEALVVVPDRLGDGGEARIDLEQLRPLDGMDAHFLHLVLGEAGRLAEDVGWGGEHSDVVEDGGDPEEEAVSLRKAEIAGEALGIFRNVCGVTGQMRLGAAGHDGHGLDGAEEDLSPLGIELSGMLHRATLLVARHPHLGARRAVSLPSRRSRRKAAGPLTPAGPGPLREAGPRPRVHDRSGSDPGASGGGHS